MTTTATLTVSKMTFRAGLGSALAQRLSQLGAGINSAELWATASIVTLPGQAPIAPPQQLKLATDVTPAAAIALPSALVVTATLPSDTAKIAVRLKLETFQKKAGAAPTSDVLCVLEAPIECPTPTFSWKNDHQLSIAGAPAGLVEVSWKYVPTLGPPYPAAVRMWRGHGTTVEIGAQQDWLTQRGFLQAGAAFTKGVFDLATEKAVRAFQLSSGNVTNAYGWVDTAVLAKQAAFVGTAADHGWWPKTTFDAQCWTSGGAFVHKTRRGVLHSTEGSRLPEYLRVIWKRTGRVGSGQGSFDFQQAAPHFTIGRPAPGAAVKTWQHLPVTTAAGALKSGPGGTNTFGAIQIEIIGEAKSMSSLAETDPLFIELKKLMRWIEQATGVAKQKDPAVTFTEPAKVTAATRLSKAAWQATVGWVGHQHVPYNVHSDPGALPIQGLVS